MVEVDVLALGWWRSDTCSWCLLRLVGFVFLSRCKVRYGYGR